MVLAKTMVGSLFVVAVATMAVMSWPVGAQVAPAATGPVLVKMLPLAKDLVALNGTATAVPSGGLVTLATVPSNKYFVVTEIAVTGSGTYSSGSGFGLALSYLDLIDSMSGNVFLLGAANPTYNLNVYSSPTGIAAPPNAALALRFNGFSGVTSTLDVLNYQLVGDLPPIVVPVLKL